MLSLKRSQTSRDHSRVDPGHSRAFSQLDIPETPQRGGAQEASQLAPFSLEEQLHSDMSV